MIILDGKKVAQKYREEIKNEISEANANPSLLIVQIGKNDASDVYIRNKVKACEEVGITADVHRFDGTCSESFIASYINEQNSKHDGIIVQFPVPDRYNKRSLLAQLNPLTDVDGLTQNSYHHPCTPLGVINILKDYNITIPGAHAVVIGRSELVGKPLAEMLLSLNATVTICHSKTRNIREITRTADILISAVGKAKYIDETYINDRCVMVDVGINRDTNKKLCGDIDFESVKDKAIAITPVPGGCGPMTVAMLLKNTWTAYKLKHGV